ncbi:hypothetical protein INS49_004920 [Diaporthe citri]|uniref:uncharacterized protein n=1 Tax=Diaporthe citri TaxID=83186 RepID=UPI001C810D91|nr:uncharacterized protein INS49_004920 [Diaporthe citri]KAG6354315.1 hypothetical protein INS49_004920 [Diaporthe citri]
MAANPNGYPPKTPAFLDLQRRAGFRHEIYRTEGKSNIDPNNLVHATAIAARTQPVAGVGAFQQGPAPRSAAAKALLIASIANRGTVGARTGIYDERYRGPTIAPFDRGWAGGQLNVAAARAQMASNNLSFVRQLGWVGDFGRSVDPGQLGLPIFMPPNNFTRLSRLWSERLGGKDGWWLPEHFSAEWDNVNYEPFSEGLTNFATGAGAAGAFNEKSNVFHIGMLIWCCMLLHVPETPPRSTPIPKSGANMGNQGWTYVGEMRQRMYHEKFGRVLCDLVSDCCKHMPADRPGLGALAARVAAGVARNPITNDDANFVQRTLQNPPPPNPEPGTVAPGARFVLPW